MTVVTDARAHRHTPRRCLAGNPTFWNASGYKSCIIFAPLKRSLPQNEPKRFGSCETEHAAAGEVGGGRYSRTLHESVTEMNIQLGNVISDYQRHDRNGNPVRGFSGEKSHRFWLD